MENEMYSRRNEEMEGVQIVQPAEIIDYRPPPVLNLMEWIDDDSTSRSEGVVQGQTFEAPEEAGGAEVSGSTSFRPEELSEEDRQFMFACLLPWNSDVKDISGKRGLIYKN